MRAKIILLIAALVIAAVACGDPCRKSKNCNELGTPYPTLESEIWESIEK